MDLDMLIQTLQDIKNKHGNIQTEACDQSYAGHFTAFSIDSITVTDYKGKKVVSVNYDSGDYFTEGL
jgi:hypothetical protein